MKNADIIAEGIHDAVMELAGLEDGTARVRALAVAAHKFRAEPIEIKAVLLEKIFQQVWTVEGEMEDWR